MASASPSSHYVGLRLRALIWSCLDCDLVRSAVFFAERYFYIDPDNHQARHLYATALLRAGDTHSALYRVQDQSCLGCTEVYSRCCNALGKFREAEEALRRCIGKDDSAIAAGECSDRTFIPHATRTRFKTLFTRSCYFSRGKTIPRCRRISL